MAAKRPSKRTDKLEVRLSPEEKGGFLEAVGKERRTASDVIRALIAQYVRTANASLPSGRRTSWRMRAVAAAAVTGTFAAFVLWPSTAETEQTTAEHDLEMRDSNGDGYLSYEEYAELSASARDQMLPENQAQFDHWQHSYFDGIDLDSDGLISVREYQAHWDETARKAFRQADLNGDGALVLDELLAGRGEERGIASSMIFVSNFFSGIYDEEALLLEDANRDEPLDNDRAARVGQIFAIKDHDRDGRITLDEHMGRP